MAPVENESEQTTSPDEMHPIVRLLMEIILLFAIGYVVLQFTWFGFDTLVDRHTYNLLNQILAPAYGQLSRVLGASSLDEISFSDDPDHPLARESISVVTLTDFDLRDQDKRWPPEYRIHADILEAIAMLDPKSIFIDFIFDEKREDDPTFDLLVYTLASIEDGAFASEEAAAPPAIFLAGHPSKCDGGVIRELQREDRSRIAISMKVTDREDYHDRTYPLRRLENVHDCNTKSAALLAYSEEVGDSLDFDDFTETMMVVWANRSAKANKQTRDCEHDVGLVDSFFRRVEGDPSTFKSRCPYHATMSAGLLLDPERRGELREWVQGRHVFYGYDSIYSYDRILPPTHIALSGVHIHAMALDNLITYGRRYLRDENVRSTTSKAMVAAALGVIAIGGGIRRNASALGLHDRWRVLPVKLRILAVGSFVGICALLAPVLVGRYLGANGASLAQRFLAASLVAVVAVVAGYRWLSDQHFSQGGKLSRVEHSLLSTLLMILTAGWLLFVCALFFIFGSVVPFDVLGIVVTVFASHSETFEAVSKRLGSFLVRHVGFVRIDSSRGTGR